jgi:hypothetical protein
MAEVSLSPDYVQARRKLKEPEYRKEYVDTLFRISYYFVLVLTAVDNVASPQS